MLFISACSYKSELDSFYYCRKLEFTCTKKDIIVSFKTSKGDFDVKLFGEDNPVTVTNFIENIKKKIYINQKFYKIIKYPQSKVIHSGVYPASDFYLEKNKNANKIKPAIPLEISFKKGIKPKYKYQAKDPFEIMNIKNFFERGSIAMAKSGEKNSSSTEFFFVTNKIPELDGRYSTFGKIVKGFEVLEKIDKKDFIYDIKIFD